MDINALIATGLGLFVGLLVSKTPYYILAFLGIYNHLSKSSK